MNTYTNTRNGKTTTAKNGGITTKRLLAVLDAQMGDKIQCDHEGYRTTYEVVRKQFHPNVLDVIARQFATL